MLLLKLSLHLQFLLNSDTIRCDSDDDDDEDTNRYGPI